MKVKKITGIIFTIVGVIGFFYTFNQQRNTLVFEERVHGKDLKTYSLEVEEGESYEIKFGGRLEETIRVQQQPYFEAKLTIKDGQNHLLFNQELMFKHEIKTDGKRSTHDGLDYMHSPKNDELMTISAQIIRGDDLDIEVYKNMGTEMDVWPGIFIIIGVIGIFVYFRSRKR